MYVCVCVCVYIHIFTAHIYGQTVVLFARNMAVPIPKSNISNVGTKNNNEIFVCNYKTRLSNDEVSRSLEFYRNTCTSQYFLCLLVRLRSDFYTFWCYIY